MSKIIDWQKWTPPFEPEPDDFENDVKQLDYYRKLFSEIDKEFNLWILHTNFYIDEEVSKIIEFTHGVESFDILSPYRARIGFGKLFEPEETKQSVRDNINKFVTNHRKSSKDSFQNHVKKISSEQDQLPPDNQ
jgi:succinate dehydrogenase flavin-adding protein (antitoxin of CptAB toxin-antitoxin module)